MNLDIHDDLNNQNDKLQTLIDKKYSKHTLTNKSYGFERCHKCNSLKKTMLLCPSAVDNNNYNLSDTTYFQEMLAATIASTLLSQQETAVQTCKAYCSGTNH